jgi:predicted methyltransferase
MPTLGSVLVPCVFVSALACGSAAPVPPAPTTPSSAAASTPIDAKLHAAVAGSVRTDRERARDAYRHPLETLEFFGLRDDQAVIELWPGGGYYTAILAPVLDGRGKLTVTHFDPRGDAKSEDTSEAQWILGRLDKNPEVFAKVARRQIATKELSFGPDASADLVLTFRNVHNWIDEGCDGAVFAAAFRVLKTGGVLGVEEHRGKPGMTIPQIKDSGYVPEDVVIDEAQRAGFRLAAKSEINANPKDTKDYPKGVWTLPPTLANKDVDRDQYLAIGESDRMTLKFVKP